ncbi:MAG TPA: ketopantoate reductase family protein [Thermoplasmata archaeon]|nr:ketopantoate reductase family protein [Thermoplasmata archaeon]
MRVLVFGAGATGSLLGAELFRAGVDVLLVGRAAHVEAIRSGGLAVEGLPGGPFRIPASESVPRGELFDRILFTVKAGDLEAGAAEIARSLAHPAPLLALQNGLGIRTRTVRALRSSGWAYAEKWVTRGIQILGAILEGPGRIRRASDREEVVLGTNGREGGLNGFDALLALGGIGVRVVDSIEREEWRKAIVNAAVNPVTADHGVENGALSVDPLRGQALTLLEEARRAAGSAGFEFSPEETEREFFRVVRGSAHNRSSMLQDLDAGRPTEIEAISGEILRVGGAHGLELPNTLRVLERIRSKAGAAARRPGGVGPSRAP